MTTFCKKAIAFGAASVLWLSPFWANRVAEAQTASSSMYGDLAPTQAVAAVRGMLLANASVNSVHPTSLSAAMTYVTSPASRTQSIVDAYNRKQQVRASLASLYVNPHAQWHSTNTAILHARMVFREYLALTKTHLNRIVWDYDFVVTKQSQKWKVADVLAYAPPHAITGNSRFDLAPNIAAHSLSSHFVQGLERHQQTVHYRPGKVYLDAYGYYVDNVHKDIRLYLFVHNGTAKPLFNLTGNLSAQANGTPMFTAPLRLNSKVFGVLLPGRTRFCVIHVSEQQVRNLMLIQSYPRQARFHSSFSFESI